MSTYIPVDLQRRVRSPFAECCAYCQTAESLTVAIFEIEHITPRSAQGETIFENLCLACPTCNRFKSNRQTAIYPIDQETVSLFHPQQQHWQEKYSCP